MRLVVMIIVNSGDASNDSAPLPRHKALHASMVKKRIPARVELVLFAEPQRRNPQWVVLIVPVREVDKVLTVAPRLYRLDSNAGAQITPRRLPTAAKASSSVLSCASV
jgi:hypothetical protein